MTKKVKVIETVIVTLQDLHHPDFCYPSRYCIRDAQGLYVFYKSTKRALVQAQVDAEYGVGQYSVRSM